MEEGSDLQFLSPGETRLTRLACPDCGGALAEIVLPQISYYRCHVGHQFGPQSLAAAQAESAEAKLWGAVATLEETAALARHLATHTDLGEDAAGQQARTADWATGLAESPRTQIQETRERQRPPLILARAAGSRASLDAPAAETSRATASRGPRDAVDLLVGLVRFPSLVSWITWTA
jgi:hypothetical protein